MEVFGTMGADTVFRVLSRKRESRRYLEGLRLVQELYSSNLRKETPELNAVGYVTWNALQGRKPCGGKFDGAPSPIVLWECFLEKLARNGAVAGDWQSLNNEIDNIAVSWGLLPLATSVEDWHAVLDKRIENLASKGGAEDGHPAVSVGLPAFRGCLSVMKNLFASIIEEPKGYHDLKVYGWSVLTGVYPAPNVVLKHCGSIGFAQFRGKPVVSASVAGTILLWEGIFDLLMHGRGTGTISFVEDYVFDALQKGSYGGPALDFWLN
jgi:hypothetical protein